MNSLIFLILLILSSPSQEEGELVILHQKVQVRGNTSLGKFNCDYIKEGSFDTLKVNNPKAGQALSFQIPIRSFSCGNFILNSDFRSTLKADQYPFAEVKVNNFRQKSGKIYCHLFLDLAGKRLEFPDFILEKRKEGLAGNLILDFATLGLSPPKKLGGLIKVEDQLDLQLLLGM